MKITNSYDCEKCLNKNICKYYENCKQNSNKDLFVKVRGKELSENLTLTIACKHYATEVNNLTYPYGVKSEGYLGGIPYIDTGKKAFEPYYDPNSSTGSPLHSNTNITISNETVPKTYACSEHLASQESSRNVSKIITSKKHI